MKRAKNPRLRSRRETIGYVVYIPHHGAFWLNDLAMQILEMIDSGLAEDQVSSNILKQYACPTATAVCEDVRRIISTLEKIQALQPVP